MRLTCHVFPFSPRVIGTCTSKSSQTLDMKRLPFAHYSPWKYDHSGLRFTSSKGGRSRLEHQKAEAMRKRRTGLPQTIRGLLCAKRPLRIRWDSRHTQIYWGRCLAQRVFAASRCFLFGASWRGVAEASGPFGDLGHYFFRASSSHRIIERSTNSFFYVVHVRSSNFRSNTYRIPSGPTLRPSI